jgi:hypothetical protein
VVMGKVTCFLGTLRSYSALGLDVTQRCGLLAGSQPWAILTAEAAVRQLCSQHLKEDTRNVERNKTTERAEYLNRLSPDLALTTKRLYC